MSWRQPGWSWGSWSWWSWDRPQWQWGHGYDRPGEAGDAGGAGEAGQAGSDRSRKRRPVRWAEQQAQQAAAAEEEAAAAAAAAGTDIPVGPVPPATLSQIVGHQFEDRRPAKAKQGRFGSGARGSPFGWLPTTPEADESKADPPMFCWRVITFADLSGVSAG